VTIRCRKQDVPLLQVGDTMLDLSHESYLGFLESNKRVFFFFSIQASIQRSIPAYKDVVKTALEVRIDQDNYLSPEMYV